MRLVALLLSAVLLVGCGSSGDEAEVGPNQNALAKAASRTQDQHSAHMTISGKSEVAGQEADSTGSGVVDFDQGESSLTTEAAGIQIQAVLADATMYMRFPAELSRLPDGKEWAKIDLDGVLGGSAFSDALGGGGSNPAQYLQQLAISSGVKQVGKEQVAGHPTTHYRAVVDYRDIIENGPESQREIAEKSLEFSAQPTVPVEVWIDDDGLIRRQRLQFETKPIGQVPSQKQDLTIIYDEFGVDTSSIKKPSDGVTEDITEQTKAALGG